MALLLEAPQGPQAYAEWTRQLARGAVAPGLLELLLRAIAVPLRKASGGAPVSYTHLRAHETSAHL
eukprot:14879695-Alexandrium_andersonii.AAC.1